MTEIDQRHVDIAFVATASQRRERFIASAAAILWEWSTDVRFFACDGPAIELRSGTRIALKVHRGDETKFDWSGVRDAIVDGCVIASETATGFAPLVPGVHFLMAPYEYLVAEAVALAFDEPRRATMVKAARDLVASTELPVSSSVSSSVVHRARHRRSTSATARRTDLERMVTELKTAILAELRMSRSIEATISVVEHGNRDHADLVTTSTWPSFDAEVSVVVPMHNGGGHLAETVRSVIAAGGAGAPRTEIVIVDDHSTDASRGVAERVLADIDWFPAMLVARAASGGPAVARNVGFAAARASLVVTLDAGSTIYPTALRRLSDLLRTAPDDVVAAYGVVERFDVTGPLGLGGHLVWDVEPLVRGELSAPIAMYRRRQWSEFDGWPSPERGVEDGWDEYDLWLSVAERGARAVHIGSVIGRHREPPAAIVKMRDVDIASSFVIARERHQRLPWPS
ncbi:MAG TPA: glycosyltransferase family A protein [Ilumatobacteraceae bacterium]|jgi:hypothetical protein